MAGLLVSVRAVEEAQAALVGGAAIIDFKEPSRGPLGRASLATWRAVRPVVEGRARLSVALGELADFGPAPVPPHEWGGIDYRKVGPAGLAESWATKWSELIRCHAAGPPWVAVIYADWEVAAAPPPDAILDVSLRTGNCRGVLVDSWNKGVECPLRDLTYWRDRVDRVQAAGRFVALAGRLNEVEIRRLGELEPDFFAVRGAACVDQDRNGPVEAGRVARLVEAAAGRLDRPAG